MAATSMMKDYLKKQLKYWVDNFKDDQLPRDFNSKGFSRSQVTLTKICTSASSLTYSVSSRPLTTGLCSAQARQTRGTTSHSISSDHHSRDLFRTHDQGSIVEPSGEVCSRAAQSETGRSVHRCQAHSRVRRARATGFHRSQPSRHYGTRPTWVHCIHVSIRGNYPGEAGDRGGERHHQIVREPSASTACGIDALPCTNDQRHVARHARSYRVRRPFTGWAAEDAVQVCLHAVQCLSPRSHEHWS
jgi:hypothetical protein